MPNMRSDAHRKPRKALGRGRQDVAGYQPMLPFAAPERPRKPFKVSSLAVDNAHVAVKRGQKLAPDGRSPFDPYEPARGVLPAGIKATMAMDDAGAQSLGWAQSAYMLSGAYAEGQMFLGYPELALMAQRPEYRLISETIATEMTRKWIEFRAQGDGEDKSDKISKIEAEFERLGVRDAFREIAVQDGFFGRAHLYLDMGEGDTDEELRTNLGNGRNGISRAKVTRDRPLKRIRTVEPVWTYPTTFNSSDPLRPDWYRPTSWYVMGKQIHVSRLLTFVGREVPDLIKPAYAFGGLSLSQMAKPYVDNWLDTRQAVHDLLKSFTVFILKTNMQGVLSGAGGDDFFRRLDMFNANRDNRGLMPIDKEQEELANVSAPLSGLDHLQAQALERIASVSRIPLVKLTGISPSGLNASSDGELRCWGDLIHSEQESLFRAHLNTVLWFVQLSLFGEVDPDITYDFLPIYELTEKEKAELRQIEAQTGAMLVETGVVSQEEERKRVAMDPTTPYDGLDIEDLPDLAAEEAEGLMPGGKSPAGIGEQAGHSHEDKIRKLFGGPAANENKPTKLVPAVKQHSAPAPAPAPKKAAANDMALDVEWTENSDVALDEQKRVPKGQKGGGQFAPGNGGSGGASAPKAKEKAAPKAKEKKLPRLNMKDLNDPRVMARKAVEDGFRVVTVNGERRLAKGSKYVTEYQMGKEAIDYAEAFQDVQAKKDQERKAKQQLETEKARSSQEAPKSQEGSPQKAPHITLPDGRKVPVSGYSGQLKKQAAAIEEKRRAKPAEAPAPTWEQVIEAEKANPSPLTDAEKRYVDGWSTSWSMAIGLAEQAPKLDTLTADLTGGDTKKAEQARRRVDLIAQKASSLAKEWQHSNSAAHKDMTAHLTSASNRLKAAVENGDNADLPKAAARMKDVLTRFEKFTAAESAKAEKRSALKKKAEQKAEKPTGAPKSKSVKPKAENPTAEKKGKVAVSDKMKAYRMKTGLDAPSFTKLLAEKLKSQHGFKGKSKSFSGLLEEAGKTLTQEQIEHAAAQVGKERSRTHSAPPA